MIGGLRPWVLVELVKGRMDGHNALHDITNVYLRLRNYIRAGRGRLLREGGMNSELKWLQLMQKCSTRVGYVPMSMLSPLQVSGEAKRIWLDGKQA